MDPALIQRSGHMIDPARGLTWMCWKAVSPKSLKKRVNQNHLFVLPRKMSSNSLLETTLQTVSDIEMFRIILEKWRSASKFWRITTLVMASYSGLCALRYIYIKSKRRYYRCPPGPIGVPFSIFLNPRVTTLSFLL